MSQGKERSLKQSADHARLTTKLQAQEVKLKAKLKDKKLKAISHTDATQKLYTTKFAQARRMRGLCSAGESSIAQNANLIQSYIKSIPLPNYAQKASILKKQIITNVLKSLEVLSGVQRATDLHGEYMLSQEAQTLIKLANSIKSETPALKQIDSLGSKHKEV